jgi:2-polyprenyl-3-methyl-5-hydroxy-6-metoxy-1,4-benzoquinol methylase
MNNSDKAGEAYWTSFWDQLALPKMVDISHKSISNYDFRKINEVYTRTLSPSPSQKLLELGCGNSVFLSYFHKEFGYDVYGLDYSELGCKQTERILARDNVKGTIVQGDIFNPPSELIGQFDVVCSFGVLEHFEDSTATVKAFSKFLKPGGTLITTVPYLKGATGLLQKIMNKPVYDIHVLMDREDLKGFIKNAGLNLTYCEYHLPISFGVTLEQSGDHKVSFLPFKKLILKSLQVLSKVCWFIDDRLFKLPVLPFFTAGIISVATLDKNINAE